MNIYILHEVNSGRIFSRNINNVKSKKIFTFFSKEQKAIDRAERLCQSAKFKGLRFSITSLFFKKETKQYFIDENFTIPFIFSPKQIKYYHLPRQ